MKKRDKIFITVIILTVIIAVLVVVLFYLNSRNKIKLWSNNENEQVNQFEEEVSMIQKQAKEKYPSFKWLSDGNLGKIQVGVEDKKVYMKVNQDGSKTHIDFDKGTPKYASSVLRGGMLEEVFVITTDGKLYIADATNYSNDGFKFKFDMCDLKEKVMDATYADEQEMYYLLESGKLVTKELKEYIPFENKIKEIQKQAKEKYPSFKWLSDGNLGKIQVGVEDKKVYMKVNQDGSKTYIDFDKGTPKYVSSVLRGGMLEEVFVITTDGKLYIADATNYSNDGFKFKFDMCDLKEKVMDATYADEQEMYYLLESGKLVTKELKEYIPFENKIKEIQKQAKEKHPSFKWLSDGNLGKIQVGVEDKKVYMKVSQDGSKTYIDFDKGTPKYASSVLRGGMLKEIVVITTDGYLFIADGSNYGNDNFEHNFNFEFYNLGYRVINATYANGEDMYYLLEDGRLVSKDLNEYVK